MPAKCFRNRGQAAETSARRARGSARRGAPKHPGRRRRINAFNATHVSVTDVVPNLNGMQINTIVNINDVFSIILGFQGQEYPGPDLTQCP